MTTIQNILGMPRSNVILSLSAWKMRNKHAWDGASGATVTNETTFKWFQYSALDGVQWYWKIIRDVATSIVERREKHNGSGSAKFYVRKQAGTKSYL